MSIFFNIFLILLFCFPIPFLLPFNSLQFSIFALFTMWIVHRHTKKHKRWPLLRLLDGPLFNSEDGMRGRWGRKLNGPEDSEKDFFILPHNSIIVIVVVVAALLFVVEDWKWGNFVFLQIAREWQTGTQAHTISSHTTSTEWRNIFVRKEGVLRMISTNKN